MEPALARLSPANISKYLNPTRKIARHVQLMSDRIRAHVMRHNGASGRLIICAPPGHAKSDTVSVHAPLWFHEMFPEKNIILTSNTAALAHKHSRLIRNTIETNPEFFLTKVSKDSAAVDMWHTTAGGMLRAVGVEGLLSGFRGHVLICDDPIADPKEAASVVQRDNLWEWFRTVADTRMWPEGTIVVMHTRWNEDDLVGRLVRQRDELRREGQPYEDWEVLNLPALAEEGDALGREVGEPLWPEEYPLDVLKVKRAGGSRRWAALYQQRPAPAGGAYFLREQFRYFRRDRDEFILERPRMEPRRVSLADLRIIQTIDTAMSERTLADWTVCLTMGITPDSDMLVLDVARKRLEVPRQMPWIHRQRDKWEPAWQGVEDKASGIGLIQAARMAGKPFKVLKADTNKGLRAESATIAYENGMIYHRSGAPWLNDFEAELLSFPNGSHDDQVDALAYAAQEGGRTRRAEIIAI